MTNISKLAQTLFSIGSVFPLHLCLVKYISSSHPNRNDDVERNGAGEKVKAPLGSNLPLMGHRERIHMKALYHVSKVAEVLHNVVK